MYKKRTEVVFILILGIIILSGCVSSRIGSNGTGNKTTTGDYYISFSVDPWPLDQNTSENYNYSSYCLISDKSGEMSDSKFNNALVSVNSQFMKKIGDGLFVYTGDMLKFNPDDEIKVSVYHSAFNQLKKNITIPPAVTGLKSEDSIDDFLNEKDNNYIFEWDSCHKVDQYLIICTLYNKEQSKIDDEIVLLVDDSSSSEYELKYSKEDFQFAEFMKIDVYNVNNSYENGIYGSFRLSVKSPAVNSLSNLPE